MKKRIIFYQRSFQCKDKQQNRQQTQTQNYYFTVQLINHHQYSWTTTYLWVGFPKSSLRLLETNKNNLCWDVQKKEYKKTHSKEKGIKLISTQQKSTKYKTTFFTKTTVKWVNLGKMITIRTINMKTTRNKKFSQWKERNSKRWSRRTNSSNKKC